MANISISEAEKTFILHGVEEDLRNDGRSRKDYRPIELETDLLNNTNGSARLRLANTDILVSIKCEIDKPEKLSPDCGKIEFFVDCSANATPQFEGRGGAELALELMQTLSASYAAIGGFDLTALCILPGQQCWKLFIDILILECGGNLYDAVSMAVKAALYNTRIPKVTAALMDAGEAELILSDDPYDCTRINVENIPLLVTVCKIGNSCVVDPSAEEEVCSVSCVVISISQRNGKSFATSLRTVGSGSLHKESFISCIKLGTLVAESLNEDLFKVLKLEEERKKHMKKTDKIGFLK